jgi:hypothetical protein
MQPGDVILGHEGEEKLFKSKHLNKITVVSQQGYGSVFKCLLIKAITICSCGPYFGKEPCFLAFYWSEISTKCKLTSESPEIYNPKARIC